MSLQMEMLPLLQREINSLFLGRKRKFLRLLLSNCLLLQITFMKVAYFGVVYSDPLHWWLSLYLQGNRYHLSFAEGIEQQTTGSNRKLPGTWGAGTDSLHMTPFSIFYPSLSLFSGHEMLNLNSFFIPPPRWSFGALRAAGTQEWLLIKDPLSQALPRTPSHPWLPSLLRWEKLASSPWLLDL